MSLPLSQFFPCLPQIACPWLASPFVVYACWEVVGTPLGTTPLDTAGTQHPAPSHAFTPPPPLPCHQHRPPHPWPCTPGCGGRWVVGGRDAFPTDPTLARQGGGDRWADLTFEGCCLGTGAVPMHTLPHNFPHRWDPQLNHLPSTPFSPQPVTLLPSLGSLPGGRMPDIHCREEYHSACSQTAVPYYPPSITPVSRQTVEQGRLGPGFIPL